MAAGFRKRDLHAPDKAVSNSVVPVSGAAVFRANEGQVTVFRGEPVTLWGTLLELLLVWDTDA